MPVQGTMRKCRFPLRGSFALAASHHQCEIASGAPNLDEPMEHCPI